MESGTYIPCHYCNDKLSPGACASKRGVTEIPELTFKPSRLVSKPVVSLPRTVTYCEGDGAGEVYFGTPSGMHVRPYATWEERRQIVREIEDILAEQCYQLTHTHRSINNTGSVSCVQVTHTYCEAK